MAMYAGVSGLPQVMRTLALCTIAAMLAGCTQPGAHEPGTPRVPEWAIGDSWSYVDGEGHWENWTVVAKEAQEGVPAFRVSATYWPPDELGVSAADAWFDQRTLGVLRAVEGDGYTLRANPPMNQLFPMDNRTYDATIFGPSGPRDVRTELQVIGWENIDTPAGTFETVKVILRDENLDEAFSVWYSPKVGNFVKRETDTTQLLGAWKRV